MKGLFITFEGTEGSGKSTQVALAAERLRTRFPDLLLLREPGGTRIGEEIRNILKSKSFGRMEARTELLLMNASRAQLVSETIRPALEQGRLIICDRFYDSTVAYQAYGRGLDKFSVGKIIEFATGGVRPDLTILLAVPVSVSEARRKSRTEQTTEASDRIEESGDAFFSRVEKGYEDLARREQGRIRKINAVQTIEEVQSAVNVEIDRVLAERFPGR